MSHSSPLLRRFGVTLCIALICTSAFGQFDFGDSGDTSSANFSFVPVPYMSYDRTLGFSIGAVPMAMYRLNPEDTLSQRSLSGLVGFYSTNKTWFGMAFTRLSFAQDKWRVKAAYGLGNFNYQFYLGGINDFIPYSTGAQFALVSVQRRVVSDLFLGVEYIFTQFKTEFDIPIPVGKDIYLHGLGLSASFDRRENIYYPREGFQSKGTFRAYPEFFGNEFVSQRVELEHNHFLPMAKDRDVLAARLYIGLGIGDVTFNQQFIVGNKDIRGYSQGEFRGDQMVAIQAEYRWNFHKRIGAVAFAGLATVFNAVNADDDGKLLPGGGVGFRYNVFPDNHMNVGFDIGAGVNDWGFYFRIGEAF